MYLPSLKYAEQKTKQQIVEFLGINFSDNFTDGNFSACRNLSTRRYPYLSTRLRRQHLSSYFRIGNSSGPSGRVTGGAGAPPIYY